MYIPNCFLEKYFKILDGDSIKVYLHRLIFGEYNNPSNIAKELNLDKHKVEESIDKLTELELWNTNIHEYQNNLRKFDFSSFLQDGTSSLSPNTKTWVSLKNSAELKKLIDVDLLKYESIILTIDHDIHRTLSNEEVLLILYCNEYLLLPELIIRHLFTLYDSVIDITKLEYKAEMYAYFQITDIETLLLFEENYSNYLTAIKEAFGIDRLLSNRELKYICDWLLYEKYPLDLVVYACLITKDRLQQIAIPYTDKILFNWKQNGITSIHDAIQNNQLRSMSKLHHLSLQKRAQNITNQIEKSI